MFLCAMVTGSRDWRVTGGLWTSNALATPPERIPLLRTQLSDLLTRYGFDPSGHAGKAMSHALTSLPHDLLVSFSRADLERVTLDRDVADGPSAAQIACRALGAGAACVCVCLAAARRDFDRTAPARSKRC
ncbi:MAG: hypothetical protein V9H26_16240 [Verrucomicrobiota bacterium]